MPDILLDQWAYINHNAWKGGVHILPDNKIVYQNWLDGHIQYIEEYKILDILDDESIVFLTKQIIFERDDKGKITNKPYNTYNINRIIFNKHRRDETKLDYDSIQWYEGCHIKEDDWANSIKRKKELVAKAMHTYWEKDYPKNNPHLTDKDYCFSSKTPYSSRIEDYRKNYPNSSYYPLRIGGAPLSPDSFPEGYVYD